MQLPPKQERKRNKITVNEKKNLQAHTARGKQRKMLCLETFITKFKKNTGEQCS
jgi:hypothetical protein